MIENKEKLIEMVEREPNLLKILKSNEHMDVLLLIFKKPLKTDELKLKTSFKNVSILYNILDTLMHANLIKKTEIEKELIYFLTDKGKEFTENYNIAKNKFDLNGGE